MNSYEECFNKKCLVRRNDAMNRGVLRPLEMNIYYMSIEIYVKYSAEIKFVFHCILYFSHVKKVVSAL